MEKERMTEMYKKSGLHMNLFVPQTDANAFAKRVGTNGFQQMFPYNKSSMPVNHSVYKSIVQPSMRKVNKSMSKHLGMLPLPGSKFSGI